MAIKKICPVCGGDNIKVQAWAIWDVDQQVWDLEEGFFLDDATVIAHCSDCERVLPKIVDREF